MSPGGLGECGGRGDGERKPGKCQPGQDASDTAGGGRLGFMTIPFDSG
jgi:hypothetical protein